MNAFTPLIDRYIKLKPYGLKKVMKSEAITWNKEKAVPEFDIDKCTLCRKCIEACEPGTLEDFTEAKTGVKTGSI